MVILVNVNTVYLILGSNLDSPRKQIDTAKLLILENIGTIVRESSIYQSPPWGFESATDFLNIIVVVKSDLEATQVLSKCLAIEQTMGRQRVHTGYESRNIDIDILFFNLDIVETKNLTIPHPRLHQRRFTLLPINELEPDLIHPKLKLPIWKLLRNCKDQSIVKKI